MNGKIEWSMANLYDIKDAVKNGAEAIEEKLNYFKGVPGATGIGGSIEVEITKQLDELTDQIRRLTDSSNKILDAVEKKVAASEKLNDELNTIVGR